MTEKLTISGKRTAILAIALCLILSSLAYSNSLATETVTIAHTNHPDATAYSNGRRMVRTSYDRRIAVYQDSLDSKRVVTYVYSDDGLHWSAPSVLANGSFPSVAIAENDWIYVVWVLEDSTGVGVTSSKDGGLTWDNVSSLREIRPEAAISCKYPVVEATKNSIHVIWQQKSTTAQTENIYYQQFNEDLSDSITSLYTLSSDSCNSRFPVIAGDLEFEPGLMHIVWCDYPTSQNPSRIMYCNFDESKIPPDLSFSNPEIVPKSFGKTHPSISVRNSEESRETLFSSIVMAYSDEIRGGITTALAVVVTSGFLGVQADSIETGPNPLPSVDDVYWMSCAIVWQDGEEIYYAQTRDQCFITLPPILVSQENEVPKKNPNVCYKRFRSDSIDVVWTEGNEPPFKVMYRRMAKRYSPQSVSQEQQNYRSAKGYELLQNYPNPFNSTTVIPLRVAIPLKIELSIFDMNGKQVRMLLSERISAGLHRVPWDATDDFGNAVASGLYFVKVSAEKSFLTKKILLLK